jgi:cytochrome c553
MRKLLLGSAIAVALLTGCGDDKKESSQASTQEIKKEETVNNTQNPTSVEKVKETTQKIEEVKETTTTLVQKKENVIIAPDKVEGEVKEITTQAAVETSTIDVNTLFKTCASCHGEKAEKLALGKSQVIAGWDKQRIIDSLNGYRNGTYGGVMKNIMTGHVKTKTDAEIEALADLISKM